MRVVSAFAVGRSALSREALGNDRTSATVTAAATVTATISPREEP